ncbi:unnamed protein product [Blepharisma stoltei]|uniref:Uncharacterized protein n=1 Tax=Blepharisma stoltei TaxID=1481888 RepID=A0AAU9IL38_9CILI|nr:unnamed protein product [Blepharisma stoltei]
MGCTANIKSRPSTGDEEMPEEKDTKLSDFPKADLSLSLPAKGKHFKIRVFNPSTNGLISEPTVETTNS